MDKEYIEHRIQSGIIKGIKFAIMGAVYVVVMGFVVTFLWNWLAPVAWGGSEITWLQGLGIWALAKALFGGRGWGGHCGGGRRGKWGNGGNWRAKWEEKWERMTPEQREQMKAKWGKHCGPGWGERHQGQSGKAETKANAQQNAQNSAQQRPQEPFSPVQDEPNTPEA